VSELQHVDDREDTMLVAFPRYRVRQKSAHKPTATDAYADAQATARDLLSAVSEALAQHYEDTACDLRDWGRVGDIGYANDLLTEVLAHLKNERR
jgi:hypothetical protein